MKGALRTALLVLLLGVVGMGKGHAQTQVLLFDFSETCPSGQTLWYKITNETDHYVELVAPGYQYHFDGWNSAPTFWENYQHPVGDLIIPEQVRGYTVTSIRGRWLQEGDGAAFFNCTGLTSVIIPNSVTAIGDYAFYGCTGLTSVVIPNSVTLIGDHAFSDCTNLTSIAIPNSITHLGATYNWSIIDMDGHYYSGTDYLGYIFQNCRNLTSITIPNSVTYIGDGTFSGCSGLTSITIPASVDTIRDKAFENCSNIREVHFDADNCTYMGTSDALVFGGCNSLRILDIGEQVQAIPNYAFYQCGFTGNLDISNAVTTIGANAFYGCSGLTLRSIGESVLTIGQNAFKDCKIGSTLVYNATNCVANVSNNNSVFDCTSLTDLRIGQNVQTIPANAFKGCSGLTNLTLPNSLTSIGASAFNGFNGTSVLIPQSVTSIGSNAFSSCPRLTTVYYDAENATGSSAFSNCANLTTVHIGANVREIHPVFGGCSSVHLVVAWGPTPAVLVSNALTDIAENSILMVSCGKRLTYYSVWNMFDFNNILEDCDEYAIDLNGIGAGGSVSASSNQAQMGQTVTLTVTPNSGMMLSSISVTNATDPTQIIPITPIGKTTSNYSFVMPPFGVKISATFTANTSVGEYEIFEANVYPNPTNDQVKIEAEDLKQITISNMLGQIIYEGNANGNEFAYNFSQHGDGIYLIRIEASNGVVTKRVAVTR